MRPQTIGRVLGIGLRVAGRVAGQRITATMQEPASQPDSSGAPGLPSNLRNRGRTAGRSSGGVARGVAGFLRPFSRVGSILWLEVSGVFFLIFVPVFVWRGMWPIRASYLHGPDHVKFLAYAGLALVFLYFGVNSFWRAGRK